MNVETIRTKTTIFRRLYRNSFNPKDFWRGGVNCRGRAHTNTSLYIQIYIVWGHDAWSCLASTPLDQAVFCTTNSQGGRRGRGLHPNSTPALCLHREAPLNNEPCSRWPAESEKKQKNRRHIAVLFNINLPPQFIPKPFLRSDVKFGMRVVTQANWNTTFRFNYFQCTLIRLQSWDED